MLLKTISSSSIFALSNHTAFRQNQTVVTVPLKPKKLVGGFFVGYLRFMIKQQIIHWHGVCHHVIDRLTRDSCNVKINWLKIKQENERILGVN
jgi:hypothetical protein